MERWLGWRTDKRALFTLALSALRARLETGNESKIVQPLISSDSANFTRAKLQKNNRASLRERSLEDSKLQFQPISLYFLRASAIKFAKQNNCRVIFDVSKFAEPLMMQIMQATDPQLTAAMAYVFTL